MKGFDFNHDQLREDVNDFKEYFFGFAKSFGPGKKKIGDRGISVFEEMNIRFRLNLVEMGISKIIRLSLLIIVGTFSYFILFRNADIVMKIIFGLAFLAYTIWLYLPHMSEGAKLTGWIVEGGKPVGTFSKYAIKTHNANVSALTWIGEALAETGKVIVQILKDINPFHGIMPSDKK
jgi:hypothetical protein